MKGSRDKSAIKFQRFDTEERKMDVALGADLHMVEALAIQALALKAVFLLHSDYPLWRDFASEYEHGKPAIDVINGGPSLREWMDGAAATPQDLNALATPNEQSWLNERQAHLRYWRRSLKEGGCKQEAPPLPRPQG